MTHFKNHKGTHSELSAQMYLSKLNYYFFKNIDNSSPVDLVAIKDKEVLLIDVKSTTMKRGYECKGRSLNARQKDLGVRLLYVYENGDCKFGD